MHFNFPTHLTDAEDRLLKKFKSVKEKVIKSFRLENQNKRSSFFFFKCQKKAFLDAKSNREQKSAQKVAFKRSNKKFSFFIF